MMRAYASLVNQTAVMDPMITGFWKRNPKWAQVCNDSASHDMIVVNTHTTNARVRTNLLQHGPALTGPGCQGARHTNTGHLVHGTPWGTVACRGVVIPEML